MRRLRQIQKGETAVELRDAAFRLNRRYSPGAGYHCESCGFTNDRRQLFRLLAAESRKEAGLDDVFVLCHECSASQPRYRLGEPGVGLAYSVPWMNVATEAYRQEDRSMDWASFTRRVRRDRRLPI